MSNQAARGEQVSRGRGSIGLTCISDESTELRNDLVAEVHQKMARSALSHLSDHQTVGGASGVWSQGWSRPGCAKLQKLKEHRERTEA